MRHYLIAGMVVCMLAAIASSASAGYFVDDGYVTPTKGVAGETLFYYHVYWQLEGEEEPPVMRYGIWDGHWTSIWDWTGMQVTTIDDGVVHYWAWMYLPYSELGWWFRFETLDIYTNVQQGPEVTPGTP